MVHDLELQKNNNQPRGETRRSPRSRVMALGMRRRHQVTENGRENEGAPVDCPGSGTPESSILAPGSPRI